MLGLGLLLAVRDESHRRGVCALYLKAIAAAAGVSVGTAREALNIADTIGLVAIKHLRGFYDIRSRSPEWLPALRERIERFEQETAGRPSHEENPAR